MEFGTFFQPPTQAKTSSLIVLNSLPLFSLHLTIMDLYVPSQPNMVYSSSKSKLADISF
jgi:hypothetical protein